MPHPSDSSSPGNVGSNQADCVGGRRDRNGLELVEDPLVRNSLREAKIILSLWAVLLIYTCTYCYLRGYESHPADPLTLGPSVGSWFGPLNSFDRDPVSLTTPLGLGIPDWVFYGVLVPWATCVVATFIFCQFLFHEDDLGEEHALATATDRGNSSDG